MSRYLQYPRYGFSRRKRHIHFVVAQRTQVRKCASAKFALANRTEGFHDIVFIMIAQQIAFGNPFEKHFFVFFDSYVDSMASSSQMGVTVLKSLKVLLARSFCACGISESPVRS